VEADAAAPVVDDHAASDADRARALLHARFGGGPHDISTIRRAAALLARRGFDSETVSAALGLDDPPT
jgi:regulatory protein